MMNNDKIGNLTIIRFLENEIVEDLYAKHVGEDLYELDNSPFYIYGVSNKDIIWAVKRDGILEFFEVVLKSGHSTYRIKLPEGKNHDYFLKNWHDLESLGCTFEGSGRNSRRVYSLYVPPDVDVNYVYHILK